MKDKALYLTVTQVLSPFSGLSDIQADVVQNAASRGTVVHKICDAIAYNFPIEDDWINELIQGYARNVEHFEKEKILVLSMVESFQRWIEGKTMFNKVHRFFDDNLMLSGECDFIYKDQSGLLTLVDLKTPVNESKTWSLQGSAYSYLAKQAGHDIQCIQFVKLDRKGKLPKSFFYHEDFGQFKAALDTYKYFYKDRVSENPLDYI
jgi:hypothetical protein